MRIGTLPRLVATIAMPLLAGCIGSPQNPATTQPVTVTSNLATTRPSFWYDQSPTATIQSADFQKLWDACEHVAKDRFFEIERADYRSGILTTAPEISAQWFEPWRRDTKGLYQTEESSIATIRRSIRFEFTRLPGGNWEVTPKVVVEREAIAEHRITDLTRVRTFFVQQAQNRHTARGSAESDLGINLPERYWYPLRRDTLYEQSVADAVQKRLNRS